MNYINHSDKILFIKEYFTAPDREYLLVYGGKGSGKYYTAKQGYNILDDAVKSDLYVTIVRNDTTIHFGNKSSPRKKYIILRETIDAIATTYINVWNAEIAEFLADPVHVQHTIRNFDLEFRRWMRSFVVSTDTGPLLDLIPLRDEFIKLNYTDSTADTLVYTYGLRGQTVSVLFNEDTFEFIGFPTTKYRIV